MEKRPDGLPSGRIKMFVLFDYGTCGNESLAGFVAFVLLEVLNKSRSKVFRLFFPDRNVCVSVSRIEYRGVYAGKFGGDFEIEVRNGFRGGFFDRAA